MLHHCSRTKTQNCRTGVQRHTGQKNSKLLRLCQYVRTKYMVLQYLVFQDYSTWYTTTVVVVVVIVKDVDEGRLEYSYTQVYSVRTDNDTCAGTSTASSTKSILHLELQLSSWRRLELLWKVRPKHVSGLKFDALRICAPANDRPVWLEPFRKIVASFEPARFSKRQQISSNVSTCQQLSASVSKCQHTRRFCTW